MIRYFVGSYVIAKYMYKDLLKYILFKVIVFYIYNVEEYIF